MSTKIREIEHPSGYKLTTPLLVPSFSSKGFRIDQKKEDNQFVKKSELYELPIICSELISESVLFSAYDIFYKYFPPVKDLIFTDFTFIDSGGYETSDSFDLSETNRSNRNVENWTPGRYKKVLKSWPRYAPAIIVSFDDSKKRKPLEEQISDARALALDNPDKLLDFLIKPESTRAKYVDMNKVIESISEIGQFPIIGVTEKELGSSILKRIENIVRLRKALEENGYDNPIHVFGSLDPITTILFFIAGADIFDGLTWLKYSYYQGMAVYYQNYMALHEELGIQTDEQRSRLVSIHRNIDFLEKLNFKMKAYAQQNDLQVFDTKDSNPELVKLFNNTIKHVEQFKNSL